MRTLPTFVSALYWRSIYSHAQRDYRCGAKYISEARLENTDLTLLSSRVFAADNPNGKDTRLENYMFGAARRSTTGLGKVLLTFTCP